MRICIDLDGTLSEGKYLPVDKRTPLDYLSLAPYDKDTAELAQKIFTEHDCYIITGRSGPDATAIIIEWLYVVLGIRDCYVSVITNPNPGTSSSEVGVWKYELCKQLGCELVFDDNPVVYTEQQPDGPAVYLVNNPDWEKNQQAKFCYNRVSGWKEIFETINNRSTH